MLILWKAPPPTIAEVLRQVEVTTPLDVKPGDDILFGK